jgi:hypothetical protein
MSLKPRAESTLRTSIAGLRSGKSAVRQKYGDQKTKRKPSGERYIQQKVIVSPTRGVLGNRQFIQGVGGQKGRRGGLGRPVRKDRSIRTSSGDKGGTNRGGRS